MAQLEIDINKRYKFPKIAETVRYAGKYLVIAPECANWIVLNTDAQQSVFEYLKQGHTIKDALSGIFNEEDVNFVVCQIEARRLCNKETHDSIEDERSMHLYLTNKTLSTISCERPWRQRKPHPSHNSCLARIVS